MAEDFKINIDAALDTSEAEKKLNSLLNEKHKITIDVDISGQETSKKLKQNIENGIKNVKIDTSALSKSLADSFNISDKSTISRLQKQISSMMSQLGKSWNGQKFDISDGLFENSMTNVVNTIKKNAKTLRSSGAYDGFYDYFKDQKILVTDALKSQLGDVNYKELLNNNIGKLVTDTKKSTATINSMWSELSGKFPNLFPDNIINQADQLNHVLDIWKKAQSEIKKISSENMNSVELGQVDTKAWESVVGIGAKMETALRQSITDATQQGKTTVDLDVNVNAEKISEDIRNAIKSASTGTGEALNLDLDINSEQILTNLRTAIEKLGTRDEPVKVNIDVDKASLQEKLNAACKDMEIPVDFKIDSEDITSKIKAAVDNIQDIELDLKVNTDFVREAVNESIDRIEPDIDNTGLTNLQQVLHGVNSAGSQTQSVFSSLGGTFKEAFSAYSLANLMQDGIYKIVDAGKEAISTVKELNDSITSLEMATGESYDTVKQMMSQYNEMGQELGAVTTDIAEGADSWLRQGKTVQETNQLLKDSMVLSKVSDLNAADSTQYLTSAMNGYKVAAEDVMGIVDKVSQVDLYSATDAGGLMEAMSRVSTMASTAGVSMDKLLGFLATTGEITQRNMSSIGESFKTIFARMSDIKAQNYELVDDDGTVEMLSDVESSLKKVGIDLRKTVTEYNSYGDVLDNLAAKWDSLNEVQQNELAKAFAGARQQEVFRTLMENYDRVKKYEELAEDSAGTAEKKFNDNYLSSLEAKTQSLKASMESLSSSLISDDMYSGFLDGAKAITDFIDKTNLLKGALAGLGTAGGLFVFQKIGQFIKEAVTEFSNLGNAMNMLKVGNLGTNEFQKLLTLTQGLSDSQMELVLSSTALTDAQRVQLLTNAGVAQAEAEAQVAAMGLSAANGTATASTVSLSSAFEGLWATLMANPLILVAAGVTAAVSAYSSYQQSIKEVVQSASEAGQAFSENYSSLDDSISKVQELRSALASGTLSEEEAYQAKSDLLSIQSQLSDSYGDQADGIDLVNGKLDEQIDKMQQLAMNNANEFLNDEEKGISKAKKEMEKERYYSFGNIKTNTKNKDLISDLQKIAKSIDGIDLSANANGNMFVQFRGDAELADESINTFMNKVRDLKNEMEDSGQDTSILDNIIKGGSEQLSKNKEILDEYQDLYKNALQADMISKGFDKGSPATVLNDYTKAVQDYNDALASGDTSAIDKAKTAFDNVQSSVDGVVKKYPEYKSMFDEVGDALDEATIKSNDFTKALAGKDFKDIVSKFKDLEDVDLKGLNINGKNLNSTQSALKAVVDEAIKTGVVADDSSESIAKVVDMLVDLGYTATQSGSSLTEAFSQAQTSIQKATSDISSLQSLLSSSMSGKGMSADDVTAFKDMFGDDAASALEKTANGYHINQQALAKLQNQQKQSVKSDYLTAMAEEQEALQKVNEQIAKAIFNGDDVSGLQSQKQNIESNISSLQDLAYQYQNAMSAYNQWQAAMSGGEEGDMYDSIQGNLESVKDLYDKGLVGENKFKEFVDLMSNQDLSNASVDQIVSAYEAAMPKMERYFTEGQEGAVNFLNDIQNINQEWAHMNEDGSWDINFGVGNDQDIADALGIDVEAVQAVMRKLKDYGFDVNLDQPVASLDELKSAAESAKESLDGLGDTSLDSINLDSSSFGEVTDNIDKVKEYIQTINDSDLEPDVKTERLEQANNILEYLVQKQQEIGSSEIDISVNIDELNSKINDAEEALNNFKNSDGTVDLSVEGAQEAVTNLQSLLYQKQALTNNSAVISVDSSQVDGALGDAIGKIQEYQAAVNNLNAQTELQKAGVQIDTSDAQAKVQQLAGEIQGLDGETKASLGLDTSAFDSALSTITSTKIDVDAGVNLDTSSLGTIQSTISAITPEILVKAGVDSSQVDGYDPGDKDATVKYKVDSSAVDAYNPKNKNATVTYSVSVVGLENLPGDKSRTLTYNVKTNGSAKNFNGTANASGTAHASGDWSAPRTETALVGELGTETIVRNGKYFTVGENGAEFANIRKGDIIFNHKQTEELFDNGHVTSGGGRAKVVGEAFSSGTAYSSAHGRFNYGSSGSNAYSSSSNSSGSSSYNTSSSNNNTNTSNTNSDTSSKAEETKETLDLIETELDRIKRNIDLVDKTASSTYKNWSKRNEALASELSQVSNELNVQQQAYNRYIQQANSVGLSEDWASKVRDGRIDIETITDSDLKDKISDYKTWYEKALDCRDAIADLREQESKLYEQKFNNLKDEYDDILDQFDHTQKMLEGYIDLTEAQGYISSSKYYDVLIENENEKLNNLTSKRNDLINSLNEALASGKIDKYSESWYDMQQEINSVDEAILDCNKNTVEWGNNIRQIGWDIFDKLEDRISDITDEADFLVDLMSSEKMYDDKNGGTITDYGKATLGLHGVKYNTYMQQADEYRQEMERLQEALNADPHNQDLLDRYDDLKDKQRDLIKNAKDEKDAIKDLVEDGINAELDALQKLIDKYSDLLDNNKDLYDYQKQLEEAQKNIASLEKQLTAYQGDNSEEGQAKRQQISNDLADARQDLEETQYERSIADQKKLLDELYDDYEEMLNLRLDNIDMLVQDVITNVNAESAGIRETLETVSSNVGYNMTESMNTIWSSANNVITTYGDKFSTQLTGVLQAINDLKNLLQQQVDAANKKAQTNTTAAKKPSTTTNKPVAKPSTNTNTNKNTTQGNGKVEIGDAVKFLSGSYYYSSDGQTPTGDEMHGQTVYITHINTASWAKKQYHIARDKAGTRPLGWVDISQISGFKNGTDYVPYDQLATVAEDGAEGIVHADGRLEKVKALSESDAVINNKSFRNLLNFSANPVEVLRDAILGNQVIPKDFIDVSTPVAPVTNNVTNNITNTVNIDVDNPADYNEFYKEIMTRFQNDKKAETMVQDMTIGRLNGKSNFYKYRTKF